MLWFCSLGSYLQSAIKPQLRPSLGFFRFTLIFPPVYMVFFQVIFEKLTTFRYVIAIFPLHMLAVGCIFFSLNFLSKGLALAETAKPVSFRDYAGTFFQLWFFPVGIWFLQPRINRLYATNTLALSS